MNKLVSRNPVLRFKLGRKIPKAFLGLNTGDIKSNLLALGYTVGLYTPEERNGVAKVPLIGGGYQYITGGRWGRIATKKEIDKAWNNNSSNNSKLAAPGVDEAIKKALAASNIKNPGYGSSVKGEDYLKHKKISTKRVIPSSKDWNKEFTNNFTNTLTNAQRQYLDSKGINYTNAAEVLKFLMDLLQTDLGGYKNDGKWGTNSILAWKDFAANNIPENFDVQRNQETMTIGNKPYVEQPTTPAPTLGYRTYNTYEGNDFSNRLNSMGIKSNADLIDFMHKTNGENYNWKGDSWARLFRSDVNLALGGDYSDANIRKTFNTSGNWRKGFLGRGDIGDFQNALQINAGIWNGIYDNKLQNLVKNIDWSKFKYYKQGGNLLPSRNIVERFKYRKGGLINFIKEALPPR